MVKKKAITKIFFLLFTFTCPPFFLTVDYNVATARG